MTLKPTKPAVGPNEEVEVEVTTADQTGKPVAAELSIALVDRSLLRLHGDRMPPIGPFFYSQTRTGAFATTASNTFRYQPATVPVAEAVVEEADRQLALAENGRRVDVIRREVEDIAGGGRGGLPGMGAGAGRNAPAPMSEPAGVANKRLRGQSSLGRGEEAKEGAVYQSLSTRSAGAVVSADDDSAVDAYGADAMAKAKKPSSTDKMGRVNRRDSRFVEPNPATRVFGDAPRERFVETAYWNPAVVTGLDGKATVKFKAPAALSEYQFTGRGVTGSDTLVGQVTAGLVVKKDFFVDLRTPEALAQGDRPRLIAEVHHMGVAGQVALSLTVYNGGKQEVFPKIVTLKGDGVDEVLFEPFEVADGEDVRLTLKAQVGEKSDELTTELPVRPWGVQAFASASGTSSDNATVFVALPPGRAYENPEMLVTIAPTLRRLIVELALNEQTYSHPIRYTKDCGSYVLPLTIADRASDLIAASAAMNYLRWAKADQAPEARRLSSKIQGLTAELITLQGDDGGWPWVAPRAEDGHKQSSDRMTSALAAQAFAAAWDRGMMTDPGAFDRAAAYLANEQAKIETGDVEMKVIFQHALASMRRGSFESANALNRSRQSLPDASLAELALTLAALDHAGLAGELLDILATRARTEDAGVGVRPRKYWAGDRQHWHRGPAETTALVALAFATVRPQAAELSAAVDWLSAHRLGDGWQPAKAKGPAVSALAKFYGQGQAADDRYRLLVTVNDLEVYRADVAGPAEGKGIVVPRRAIRLGDRNRVRFEIEGRGTFGYAVSLTGFARDLGPEQDRSGKLYTVHGRDYLAADPEQDGKVLPTGFGSTVNAPQFSNKVTQVGLGGRARVHVSTMWNYRPDRPSWERDFIVVEETLPAGATLIEGSLLSSATNYTQADGVLTLYFAPGVYPGNYQYDVFGTVPGRYRAAPTRIRSAYEPGRQHLGPAGELRVLNPGETSNDPYKATPDELFARGKALVESGRLAEAAGPLEELFGGYTLRDNVLKEAARMLLTIHIKDYQPRKIVQDFEVLKEKAPEVVIPFDEVAVVGRAYRDIGEHERAFLVWRAIVEASYLEDAQVGEALRQKGKTLDAIVTLLDLWREYPNTASIEADLFGLSQLLATTARKAIADPATRKDLLDAGVTRSELILQAIRLNQLFLAASPKSPMADEVSLAQVGDFLEIENFEAVVRLSERFAALYPKSSFLDSFQYSEALGRFNLGEYDRSIRVAETISKATYKDAGGIDQPSPNKWQAIYILGQIYDARRQPAKAVEYYKLVADRFSDAAGAVKGLTRKGLKVPEVSLVRPGVKVAATDPHPLPRAGLMRVGAEPPKVAEKPVVALDYRNIPEADVKVYPVDLMRLYLTRRNLNDIAGIDLAGITPLFETTIKLGDGQDYADKIKSIDLPLDKEGAYLVMIRGENLYTSGIVMVSPLELEVLEEADAGRVRVAVRDAKTKDPVPKVNVKVIGTDNPAFFSGQTDLRGVFVAEGVVGQVTAVARRESSQYAFYRGTTRVGAPAPTPPPAPGQPMPQMPGGQGANPAANNAYYFDLGENVKNLNNEGQGRQVERLKSRYGSNRNGIMIQEAK